MQLQLRSTVIALVLGIGFSCSSHLVQARDILLIDDLLGGFGPTANLLSLEGHSVTELTGEVAAGYSRVSSAAFLANYDMVVYASRNSVTPPPAAAAAMENFIQNGGDLLLTGFQQSLDVTDRSIPNLLRALGPEYSYSPVGFGQSVRNVDNYITNGPHGDFRGTSIANPNGFAQLFANTGLGTVPLVQGTSGQPDKIIFTDLPGAGGSIGAWQGGSSFSTNAAQPDFYDGGTFQGMLLNWAEGGTTNQTEVTPRIFTTDQHPLASSVSVDFYLGDPNDGGELAGRVGPVNIVGSMDIVAALDGSGDGTLAITNSSVKAINALNQTADFGFLGTAEIDFDFLDIYMSNQPTAVQGKGFDLADSPYYLAGIAGGELSVHSPTGALGVLLEDVVPLDAELPGNYIGGPDDLLGAQFTGTYDEGIGLSADGAEVNLFYDDIAIPVIDVEGLGELWGVIHGEIHVAYVPEPSGVILGFLAMAGFLAAGRRRLRQCRLRSG